MPWILVSGHALCRPSVHREGERRTSRQSWRNTLTFVFHGLDSKWSSWNDFPLALLIFVNGSKRVKEHYMCYMKEKIAFKSVGLSGGGTWWNKLPTPMRYVKAIFLSTWCSTPCCFTPHRYIFLAERPEGIHGCILSWAQKLIGHSIEILMD